MDGYAEAGPDTGSRTMRARRGTLVRAWTESERRAGDAKPRGRLAKRGRNMRINPEISETSIVLVGSFTPAIFTPAWFVLHGLLPKGTDEIAKLEVAHPQVTSFSAERLILNVIPERFSVETVQAPDVRVLDLVVRTFKEHLNHTPLKTFGINRSVHFRVRSPAERDRIGRMLVPVEPWGAWGEELGLDGTHGGMTSLTMSQIDPKGRPKGGRINVKVEPLRPNRRRKNRSVRERQRSLCRERRSASRGGGRHRAARRKLRGVSRSQQPTHRSHRESGKISGRLMS